MGYEQVLSKNAAPVFISPLVTFCSSRLLTVAVWQFSSLVNLGAASSQLGFFYQTGGEIDWGDATSFAFSEEGRKVLLSEGATPLAFTCIILIVSWIVKLRLYKAVSAALAAGEIHARSGLSAAAPKSYKASSTANLISSSNTYLVSNSMDCVQGWCQRIVTKVKRGNRVLSPTHPRIRRLRLRLR